MSEVSVVWRPQAQIKIKALGLLWRGDQLLVAEVYRDDGTLKGVRPLGGTVEFGESWFDTLVREFQEELAVDVHVTGAPIVRENIYTHEGAQGHEVVFCADIAISDPAEAALLMANEIVLFTEDNGTQCRARWMSLDEAEHASIALYPDGLARSLARART